MIDVSSQIKRLSDYPQLLPDSRVEKLWYRLLTELRMPEEVSFATYEQPPREVHPKTTSGIELPPRLQPAQAVFLVVSPNPHPRHVGRSITSYAFVDLRAWQEKEREAWRFVGAGDPAYTLFKRLCHEHMGQRQHWTELN